MNLRADSHVHTAFSPDGRSRLEEYALRVDQDGLEGLGFSEHYEFWPESDACGYLDEVLYLKTVEQWRSRGYPFFAGVEVDWMPEYEAEIRVHLRRHRFAFVIASVHNLPTASVSGRDIGSFTEEHRFDRVLDEYHAAVSSSLAIPEFDVVGHVGVYGRHLSPSFGEGRGWKKRIESLEDDLARKAAASGKLVEVNTSGLFCARGEPCPGSFFLGRYRSYGGGTLTLGSDAHHASEVIRGFEETALSLRSLGFQQVFLPWDKDNPIDL